jgi:hypothetical protein
MKIMESTALMTLSRSSSTDPTLTTEGVYELDQSMAVFLKDSISQDGALGPDNLPFKVTVETKKQSQDSSYFQTLEAVITCLYTSEGVQAALDTALMRYADASKLPFNNVTLSFRPFKDAFVISSSLKGAKANTGLLIATGFLTVMLVTLSCVLIYVTGGWNACQQKLSNCCFEEVDDYTIDNKSTFQVDSVYGDNDNGSIETGMVTSATGVLGAHMPAVFVGEHASRGNADDETATQVTTDEPLGISSMRKMHPPASGEVEGLTHMIMNRLSNFGTHQ